MYAGKIDAGCIKNFKCSRCKFVLTDLAKQGVWLGMDRTPGAPVREGPSGEDRTQAIKKLVDAGHAGHLMVGHDWSIYLGTSGEATRRLFAEHNPDRFLYITRRQLPRLRELGVSEADIRAITVDNPRRFFEGQFWTCGEMLGKPKLVVKGEKHQISCMLFKKKR